MQVLPKVVSIGLAVSKHQIIKSDGFFYEFHFNPLKDANR